MNDLDKTLKISELDGMDFEKNNVYDPFYTPSENSKLSDNQQVGHKGYFYIECYGC